MTKKRKQQKQYAELEGGFVLDDREDIERIRRLEEIVAKKRAETGNTGPLKDHVDEEMRRKFWGNQTQE